MKTQREFLDEAVSDMGYNSFVQAMAIEAESGDLYVLEFKVHQAMAAFAKQFAPVPGDSTYIDGKWLRNY